MIKTFLRLVLPKVVEKKFVKAIGRTHIRKQTSLEKDSVKDSLPVRQAVEVVEEVSKVQIPPSSADETGERKVYGYARVSSDKQSVQRQVSLIREYAEQKGLGTPKIFSEKISSTKKNRGLYAFLKVLKEGDILIVDELSRLGRSISQILSILEMLEKNEVHLLKESLVVSKDSSNSMSRLLLNVLASVAQLERELLSERTKCGLLEARRNNKILGRPRKSYVLRRYEGEVKKLLKEKASISFMARHFGVSRSTVYNFLEYLKRVNASSEIV